MGKPVTVKDVLYGLEYMGQELVRAPASKPGAAASWSLQPSGAKVADAVATAARNNSSIVPAPSHPGESRYRWQGRAA